MLADDNDDPDDEGDDGVQPAALQANNDIGQDVDDRCHKDERKEAEAAF